MNKSFFRTGSNKARFWKLAVFLWHNIQKFGILSLAAIWKTIKQAFCCLKKFNWIKLLKGFELIIKIVNQIRSLLSFDQTQFLLKN